AAISAVTIRVAPSAALRVNERRLVNLRAPAEPWPAWSRAARPRTWLSSQPPANPVNVRAIGVMGVLILALARWSPGFLGAQAGGLVMYQRQVPRQGECLLGAAERGAEERKHPVGDEEPGEQGN